MKNFNLNKSFQSEKLIRFNLKMKLTALLLLVSFFNIHANSYSQNKKISLALNQVTVEEVFGAIEALSEFRFLYNTNKIDLNRKVSVHAKKQRISSILKQIFVDSNVSFVVKNTQIILTNVAPAVAPPTEKTIMQQRNLTGTVVDENGVPLAGATVLVKGTTNGTTTDFDGKFSLQIDGSDTALLVSYIGFSSMEITISDQDELYVQLVSETSSLDEVVLVGYGSVRKGDVSTSVGVVNAEDLNNQITTGFDQAISGKIAGVQVLQTSGSPGGNVSIRVRGTASIGAGNDPLYVIDGIPLSNDTKFAGGNTSLYETPTNPLNAINTNDIESIQILKDAAAAAIYGSRGSNGVVLITTKKGKSGKLNINYNVNVGMQSVTKRIDLLDAYQYSLLTRDARNNTYQDYLDKNNINGGASDSNATRTANGAPSAALIPHQILPYLDGKQGLTNTDWQDEIFNNDALMTIQTLTFSGGSENIKYFVSGNYLNQEGVVINSGFKKYGTRINLDFKSGKFHAGVNIAPSFSVTDKVNSEGRYADEGIIALALGSAPIFPVYNADGTYNFDGNGNTRPWGGYSQTGQLNPVAVANLSQDELSQFNFLGSTFFEYEFIDGLTYKLSIGADLNNFRRSYYRPSSLEKRFTEGSSNPIGYSRTDQFVNWVIENTLNYNKQIEDHSINVLLGYTAQKNQSESNSLSATNFPNDLVQTLNAGTVTNGESRKEEYSLLSYLARIQYGYKNKYLLTPSIRADGSSRFGANNKWGLFPSLSAAWKVKNEAFLEDSEAISDLKIRASYGVTGNFDIGNYVSQGLIGSSNYLAQSGLAPLTARNEDLTWEKTFSTNFGLNLGFLKNKISLEVDHYISNTEDLLLELPVSTVSGFDTSLQNIGRVQNRGWEFLLGFRNNDHKFKWDVNFNISTNKNEVKQLGPENEPIIVKGGASNFFITRVGDPIGSYYTLVTDGIFETQEELDNNPSLPNARVGDIRYKDVSGDGSITQGGNASQEDRTITGSYYPDYTFGISGGFNYENFDLGFTIQASQGNEVMNILSRYINNVEGNFNNRTDVLNRWVSSSDTGNGVIYRANRVASGNNGWTSDWHVEDGSFIRLQNVSLGYNFSEKFIEKMKIDRFRLSLTGQNLFTISDYSGYNPEVNGRFNVGGLNNITPGEDYGTYPLSKTISLGLNVSF